MKPRPWLLPAEAAYELGISVDTVKRYVTDGVLKGYTLPSGHLRVDAASVQALIEAGAR